MDAFGHEARNGEDDSQRQDTEEDDGLVESRRPDRVCAALGHVFRDGLPLGEGLPYHRLLKKL